MHPIDLKLSNVTLLFFPPNTKSKIQPLDQGIICCFKAHYRTRLVKHIISSCTMAYQPEQVVVTALDAIHWILAAWDDVSESTICNTFRTAGFQRHGSVNMAIDDAQEVRKVTIDSVSVNTDDNLLKNLDFLLVHAIGTDAQISTNEFVKLDDEIPVFDECDNNIDNLLTVEDVQNDQDDKDEEVIQEQPPSLVEALEMIRKLGLLASTRKLQLYQLVTDLESKLTDAYIDSKSSKQSSIIDFFPKA